MYATARTAPADSRRTDAPDAQYAREASDVRPPGQEQNTDCQYMRALERANEVRLARADLKRKVAAGTVSAAEVVLDCPWEAESMAVSDLLTSQRRWGHTRCRKLLAQVPLTERKTIGSMTERQRRTLAALLPGDARAESAAVLADDGRATAHAGAPAAAQQRALVTA
jgi:hypothetical protein